MLKLQNIKYTLKYYLRILCIAPFICLAAVLNHEYNIVYVFANSETLSILTTAVLLSLPIWYFIESDKDAEKITTITCGFGIILNFICLAATSTAYMSALLGAQLGNYFYANVAILYTSLIFGGNLAILAIYFASKFIRKEILTFAPKKSGNNAVQPPANSNAQQRSGFIPNPNGQGGLQRVPEFMQNNQ